MCEGEIINNSDTVLQRITSTKDYLSKVYIVLNQYAEILISKISLKVFLCVSLKRKEYSNSNDNIQIIQRHQFVFIYYIFKCVSLYYSYRKFMLENLFYSIIHYFEFNIISTISLIKSSSIYCFHYCRSPNHFNYTIYTFLLFYIFPFIFSLL